MSSDICFDIKTFLEKTCRTCSRYYCDEVEFYPIFHINSKETSDYEHLPDDELLYEVNDNVKQIFDEFNYWKLNIKPNDGMPQQICANCRERFKQVQVFREECLDSQKVLESYFLDFDCLLNAGRLTPKSSDSPRSASVNMSPEQGLTTMMGQKHPMQNVNGEGGSPFSSPRLRFSPRFAEVTAYADSNSSIGTPPPLFEEIKTEPIDMETMESIKPECELHLDDDNLNDGCFNQDESDAESSQAATDMEETLPDDGSSSSDESLIDYSNELIAKKSLSRLQCKVCGLSCANRQLLSIHRLHHHPQEKPFKCTICNSAFKSRFLLSQHQLKHNRPDTLQCEQCCKYFRSQLHLQRHIKNFHLTSTYTCHICHQQFENYTQMRFQYHVRQHGEKRFSCSYCTKGFHQKIHLINHERTHTKEQPFRCNYCDKAFSQQTACQEHSKTHSNPTPFKCSHCSKSFTQRSTLRIHLRKVHNVKKSAAPAVEEDPINRTRHPVADIYSNQHFMNF